MNNKMIDYLLNYANIAYKYGSNLEQLVYTKNIQHFYFFFFKLYQYRK